MKRKTGISFSVLFETQQNGMNTLKIKEIVEITDFVVFNTNYLPTVNSESSINLASANRKDVISAWLV